MSVQFAVGDLVRVRDGHRVLWRVVADDTDKTPVHDPEPAYRLENAQSRSWPKPERYAYESDLESAS